MANNAGRQGGGGGNSQMNEHVEFTVKAEEDLYLTGSETTIRRVTADTNYSCLMLKTQRFSSLFRHYAKYHGLRKDDLEYYFVNPLENEDTPESVQLQRGDVIMVRKRRKPDPPEPAADDEEFFKDMKELLDDEEHMDTLFLVRANPINPLAEGKMKGLPGLVVSSSSSSSHAAAAAGGGKKGPLSGAANVKREDGDETMEDEGDAELVEIRAHKCILTARADYFKALFRKSAGETSSGQRVGTFRESTECVVRVEPEFSPKIVRLMLEFLYTNRIECVKASTTASPSTPASLFPVGSHEVETGELLSLLHLADMWQLRDLKRLVEHELIRGHMNVTTVARMYCATEDFHAKRLSSRCIEFIMDNYREVTQNAAFQEDMKAYPHLCIPLVKEAAKLIPPAKKQRTSGGAGDFGGGSGGTPAGSGVGGGVLGSSPVPDSDA